MIVSRRRSSCIGFALFASCAALVLASASSARAATLQVGPTRTYTTVSAAIAAASDGDVIEIDAGRYAGDIATIRASNLTIRGVGGFAHLDATGVAIPNGKAIWVQQGDNLFIESIEMSGASVPDQNGAGIRIEADGLVVTRCYFHDNENGILGGDGDANAILIVDSEFARNGYGDGYSHNIYIGRAGSLTVRGTWFHHAHVGHELKSRAAVNVLTANRFSNEDGDASYEIDLPEGGLAILIGNVVQQGNGSENGTIVSYAGESQSWPTQELYVVHNTIVNDRTAGGTFVRYGGTPTVLLQNNLFVGGGMVLGGTGGAVTMEANIEAATYAFVDRAGIDYHLTDDVDAIDAAAPTGIGGGMALTPLLTYRYPTGTELRVITGDGFDVGAFELVDPTMPPPTDAGPIEPTDAGPIEPSDGGPIEPSDAGLIEPGDAGTTPGTDAGPTPPGDAAVAVDGSTPPDGGRPTSDAGTMSGGDDDDGCGCRVAGAKSASTKALGVIAFLLVALCALRMRRRD